MPLVLLKSVREVSSEDSVHVAANLLQDLHGKKWKTKFPGEKSAYVTLEVDRPQFITGIDIANEHSAFVEVQVGNATGFSDILITCSFMTPFESKNSTNTNRVRCFGRDALVESNLGTKWPLIKVICTQPFNKHVQFGLSFIKVHTTESTIVEKQISTDSIDCSHQQIKPSLGLGKFTLRANSPDSDSESAAGLFRRWKIMRNRSSTHIKSAAAAIRDKSSPSALRCLNNESESRHNTPIDPKALIRQDCDNIQPHGLDRNRNELLVGNDIGQGIEQWGKKIKVDLKRRPIEKETNDDKPSVLVDTKINTTWLDSKNLIASQISVPAKKIKSSDVCQFRPFNKLLNGVVLVISGIQNPDRADLRRKALAMGAKYKSDWDCDCTHLICAFKNTPKYSQVRNKGKIVTRNWIERCYAMKKYLPWRRFAIDTAELDRLESDEEIWDEALKPAANEFSKEKNYSSTYPQKTNIYKCHTLNVCDLGAANEESSLIEDKSYISGSDTDDEIERVIKNTHQKEKQHGNKNKPNNRIVEEESIYDALTEEEGYLKEKC